MPSKAALDLLVQLKGNASKQMDDMAKKGGGLGRVFGALMGPIGLVTVGIGALGAGMGLAVKAAADEQIGVERLNVALRNSVPNFEAQTDAVNTAIKAAEKKAFADDAARDSLALLVGVTKSVTGAQEAQAAAMDIARLKGISLEESTSILISAFGGKTKALEKMGVELKKGATDTDILAAVQKLAGGQAEAYANTTAGSMDRLKVAFGNALENIGGVILPKVTEALSGLADFVSSDEFQGGLTAAVDLIGNGLSWAAKTVGPPLIAAAQSMGKFIGAVASGDTKKIKELFVGLPEPIRNVAGFLVDAAKGASDFVGKLVSGDLAGARDVLKELPEPISKIASGLFDAAKNATDFLTAQTPEAKQFWKDLAADVDNTKRSINTMIADWDKFIITMEGLQVWADQNKEIKAMEQTLGGVFGPLETELHRVGPAVGDWIKSWTGDAQTLADECSTVVPALTNGRAQAETDWATTLYNLGLEARAAKGEIEGCVPAFVSGLPEAKQAWTECLTTVQTGLDACKTTGGEIAPALGAGVPDAQKAWDECNTTIKTGLDECKVKGETFWNYVLNPGVDGSEAQSFWSDMLDRIRGAIAAAKRFWDEATRGAGGNPPGDNRTYPDHGRASGGPVTGGSTYMVGERGPELFTPRTSGQIIPNNAMGGNTIYLTVNAGIGADGRRIGQEALEVLSHQLGLQGRNVSHRGV